VPIQQQLRSRHIQAAGFLSLSLFISLLSPLASVRVRPSNAYLGLRLRRDRSTIVGGEASPSLAPQFSPSTSPRPRERLESGPNATYVDLVLVEGTQCRRAAELVVDAATVLEHPTPALVNSRVSTTAIYSFYTPIFELIIQVAGGSPR